VPLTKKETAASKRKSGPKVLSQSTCLVPWMPIPKTKATPAVKRQTKQEDASPAKRQFEQEPSLQASQLGLLDAKLCSGQYNHKEDAKKGDFMSRNKLLLLLPSSMPRQQLLPMGWAIQNRRPQIFGHCPVLPTEFQQILLN
jgi:hypothetical protein